MSKIDIYSKQTTYLNSNIEYIPFRSVRYFLRKRILKKIRYNLEFVIRAKRSLKQKKIEIGKWNLDTPETRLTI